MATLYTFGASHYCEKARWALDLSGLDYEEVRWAPGPHLIAVRGLAPGTSVPILRLAGSTIQGSDRIIDRLEAEGRGSWCTRAEPDETEEIVRLERRADEGVGVAVRRLAYAMTLPAKGGHSARRLFTDAVWWQRPLARVMWPVTRRAIMRGLGATAADLPDARAGLERELDHFDALLADGRRFLVGGRFSRADIALASLLSPIADPPQHPVYPGLPDSTATETLKAAYGDRPCVHWACRVYRDCRTQSRSR